jgi:DNA-binding transcriptional MerR regulator
VRIGELAELSGVPAKTIRYYEEIDVLAAPARTASGYREYDESTLDRLAFVRAAQALGFTLGEIREIVALRDRGEVPCGHVLDLLRSRADDLERRISELQRLRSDLDGLASRARRLDPADCDTQRVCHLIGTRPAPAGGQPPSDTNR